MSKRLHFYHWFCDLVYNHRSVFDYVFSEKWFHLSGVVIGLHFYHWFCDLVYNHRSVFDYVFFNEKWFHLSGVVIRKLSYVPGSASLSTESGCMLCHISSANNRTNFLRLNNYCRNIRTDSLISLPFSNTAKLMPGSNRPTHVHVPHEKPCNFFDYFGWSIDFCWLEASTRLVPFGLPFVGAP